MFINTSPLKLWERPQNCPPLASRRTDYMLTSRSVLLLIMLAAVTTSGFNGVRIAPHATLSDAVFVLLVGAWVIFLPFQRHVTLRWSVVWSLFLFILAFVASYFVGTSDQGVTDDLAGLARILIPFFVLPYLISDIVKTDQHARAVVVAFVASAIVNVILSLLDATGLTDFQSWMRLETVGDWGYETRLHGLAMHPNHFGQMCAIAALLAVGVFPENRYRWKRAVWAASEALLVVGIFASGSRAALLAAVVVGLLLSLKYRRVLRLSLSRLVLVAGVAAASAAALFYLSDTTTTHGAAARLLSSSPDLGVEQSNAGRIVSYNNALEDFATSPILGIGFSHFGEVENLLLQFLRSAGMIGLVGLVLYFYPPWKAWRHSKPHRPDLLMVAAASGVGVYLVFTQMVNLTYARFSLIPVGILWALQRRSRVMNTDNKWRRLREKAFSPCDPTASGAQVGASPAPATAGADRSKWQ